MNGGVCQARPHWWSGRCPWHRLWGRTFGVPGCAPARLGRVRVSRTFAGRRGHALQGAWSLQLAGQGRGQALRVIPVVGCWCRVRAHPVLCRLWVQSWGSRHPRSTGLELTGARPPLLGGLSLPSDPRGLPQPQTVHPLGPGGSWGGLSLGAAVFRLGRCAPWAPQTCRAPGPRGQRCTVPRTACPASPRRAALHAERERNILFCSRRNLAPSFLS